MNCYLDRVLIILSLTGRCRLHLNIADFFFFFPTAPVYVIISGHGAHCFCSSQLPLLEVTVMWPLSRMRPFTHFLLPLLLPSVSGRMLKSLGVMGNTLDKSPIYHRYQM